MSSNHPVSFSDLQVGYDANLVLHGISADIDPGTCVAITGDNGSGKSTLLRALLGIAPIVGGHAYLYGHEVTDGRGAIPWDRIGYVPQRASVGGGISSTVQEVVETGCLGPRRWWLNRECKRRVQESLTQVGLEHRRREAFRFLSGGQQQRVLIARALVRRPDLLVLDEPLTGLDSYNREMLAGVIAAHKREGGTSLIVLHELGELAPLIDRELGISAGHLVHDGPCTHLIHDLTQPHHHSPPAAMGQGLLIDNFGDNSRLEGSVE